VSSVKAARSSRRAIRIVSQCATGEEFVAAFHPYLDRDSLFIATGSPEEPGQSLRFVLTLAGGETVLRGAGRVLESHRDRGNFYGLRGMKLQFDELDDGSRRALAALENRAGGRRAPRPGPTHPPSDVIECLIYDEPESEAADPAAGNAGRRAARPAAERGLPLGDDDVTAVAQAPPRPGNTRRGSGSVARQGTPPQVRPASGPVSAQMSQQMPSHGEHGEVPMSFTVPRPRSDTEQAFDGAPGRPDAHGHGSDHSAHAHDAAARAPRAGSAEMADLPTDLMPAARPRTDAPHMGQASLRQSGVGQRAPMGAVAAPQAGGGSGPHLDYDRREPSHPHLSGPPGTMAEELSHGGHHRMPPPELGGFAPDFLPMPQTRTGLQQRGIPRPPMPAERTEIVRVRRRPSTIRVAAVSTILGALLGLGAGYLLWGEHGALLRGDDSDDEPAAKPPAKKAGSRALASEDDPPPSAALPVSAPAADAGPGAADEGQDEPDKPARAAPVPD
jgi:hypothetical protein